MPIPAPTAKPPSVLLVIPPLTQLNTPYPSTAYLTGFLRSRGYVVAQADVGIEMVLALFSREGLARVFASLQAWPGELPGEARQMLALARAYLDSIDAVVGFLQGRDPAMAPRICQGQWLPRGPRFSARATAGAAEGPPTSDRARHLATLYLEDLADLVRETIAPQFALSRYAESVGLSASSFDSIEKALSAPPSLTDEWMLDAFWRHVDTVRPSIIGLSVPFPGNLYGAFRLAQAVKARRSDVTIILGGGYPTTELRRLDDPRVFDYVDYVTLDDGERPLLCLLEHAAGTREVTALCRTFTREGSRVRYRNGCQDPALDMTAVATPTYVGLPLDRYLSVLDTLNPMHRLWSDGHWNKLTVAHGCYWKQCAFCDVGLDYIAQYDPTPSAVLVDRIEALLAETGRRGFHFVDEAAPPAGLKGLALTLLERGLTVVWWGNIRFEPAFTPDLCRLLAASGCIAISAGLETPSDRVLAAMKKGISLDDTARVAAAFRQAGILVHAYLMYGYPGETRQETIDGLERVRQLFAGGLIQSGFWHRFVATAHSPIGLDPAAHGIRLAGPAFGGFAENDLAHEDLAGDLPAWVGQGLRLAMQEYLEGRGLQREVRRWFTGRMPRPAVSRRWLSRTLVPASAGDDAEAERRFLWIGGTPVVEQGHGEQCRLVLPNRLEDLELRMPAAKARWLVALIEAATPVARRNAERAYPRLRDVRDGYPMGGRRGFEAQLRAAWWGKVRGAGLLLV